VPWSQRAWIDGDRVWERFAGTFYSLATATGPTTISFWARGDDEHFRKRMLGCMIMCTMPSAGLDEALVSLHDVFEYWNRQPQQHLMPPAVHRSQGKVVLTKTRPEMIVSE